MKKIIGLILSIFSLIALNGQEKYFTLAPSGLIIREGADINSNRVGKLSYGSVVELIEKTKVKNQIKNKEENLEGVWVKIKYQNFPFIISESKEYEFNEEGYVFSQYIEKLNKASIESKEIDSVKFFSLYKPIITSKPKKINSQKETEKLLGSRVKWRKIENLGRVVDEILLENGQKLHINQKSNDYGFVSYYPAEEIIIFEGGHTSDFSISIKTGESLETAGNPEYIIESPNKKLRLNGWFPGQECSSYFFQEKTGSNYTYLVEFGWGSDNYGENVCYFNKFQWLNDNEFIYSYTDYTGEKGIQRYFISKIKTSN